MKTTLMDCVRGAGKILRKHFGTMMSVSRKENRSSVVTAADWESERFIAQCIRQRFPQHNLIGEETGGQHLGSEFTWIIDPLDGTSNFAAGLPWFGVMVAVLQSGKPILGAMYLPVDDRLYWSESGNGVWCDDRQIALTAEADLGNVLCAYGLDAETEEAKARKEVELLRRLASQARNLRSTNCLVDLCFTLDGRLGAYLNHACKIWDIAPACLMFQEAGGCFTDLQGEDIRLSLEPQDVQKTYAVLGANPTLHRQVLDLVRESGY